LRFPALEQTDELVDRVDQPRVAHHVVAEHIAAGAEVDLREFQQLVRGEELRPPRERGLPMRVDEVAPHGIHARRFVAKHL